MNNCTPLRWMTAFAICLLVTPATLALASPDDDHHKGRHKGYGGHHHKHHGGHSFFGISRHGFTYQDKHFGLSVGPFFPGPVVDHHHHHHCHPPTVIEAPVIVQPVVPAPVLAAPAIVQPVVPAPVVPVPAVTPVPAASPEPDVAAPAEISAYRQRHLLIDTNRNAAMYQRRAEIAFRYHQYADAARDVRHAILEDNLNGRLRLFAAQTQFAIGDYQGACESIDAATQLLYPADWGHVVENFRKFYNNGDYVKQMDALVRHCRQNPRDAYARTLRGYHYQYLGHPEAARKQLDMALSVNPRNGLANRLVTSWGTGPDTLRSRTPVAPASHR